MGRSNCLQIVRRHEKFPRLVGRFTTQVLLLAVLFSAGIATAAKAGTMRLYSCQTPIGRVVGTHGWSVEDLCSSASPGFLQFTQMSTFPWSFTGLGAASDTTIG